MEEQKNKNIQLHSPKFKYTLRIRRKRIQNN